MNGLLWVVNALGQTLQQHEQRIAQLETRNAELEAELAERNGGSHPANPADALRKLDTL